jgi:two-component system, NarL family, nitrate/nitrite response regulator NarL
VLMDLDMPECNGFEATQRVLACSPTSRIVILTASHEEQHLFHAIQAGAVGYLTKDIEPDALVRAIRSASRDEFCLPPAQTARLLTYLRSLSENTKEPKRNAKSNTNFFSAIPTTPAPLSYNITRIGEQTDVQEAHSHRHSAHSSTLQQVHPLALNAAVASEGRGTGKLSLLTERECEVLDLMRKGRKNREIAGELRIAESTVHKHVQNIFEKLQARNRTEAIYLTQP